MTVSNDPQKEYDAWMKEYTYPVSTTAPYNSMPQSWYMMKNYLSPNSKPQSTVSEPSNYQSPVANNSKLFEALNNINSYLAGIGISSKGLRITIALPDAENLGKLSSAFGYNVSPGYSFDGSNFKYQGTDVAFRLRKILDNGS